MVFILLGYTARTLKQASTFRTSSIPSGIPLHYPASGGETLPTIAPCAAIRNQLCHRAFIAPVGIQKASRPEGFLLRARKLSMMPK
ncbi:hypothetical protein [Salipiger sp. PrR003]|uniref:hypothetical protein n=1 Tax=Salipiger sp. PrR003 TaxID=2706776 RepID=UPI0013D974F4|nr:hypothetical protein [Salipiger sp. PrR003]NDV51566.1 hypothetical protein [Salipiger sp. PrR003]